MRAACREVIANKSKAAAGLCDWAINIVKYFDVVAEVEPKRAELAAANGKLNDANATLKTVQDKVAGLNAQVRSLEEAYSKVCSSPKSPCSDCSISQWFVWKNLHLNGNLRTCLALVSKEIQVYLSPEYHHQMLPPIQKGWAQLCRVVQLSL